MNFPGRIVRFLLPFTCLLCHAPSGRAMDLCTPCLRDLPAWPQNGCPRCARPVWTENSSLACGACLDSPPPFETTHILFCYLPPITRLLTRLKFQHHLIAARVFGELLAERILADWYQDRKLPDVILPVPLHPSRTRSRGFNQTLEIARPVARRLNLPLWPSACERIRSTLPQSSLPASARKRNVRGAFAVRVNIKGLHIAIVEDVMTTGSTMTSLCQTLTRAGARQLDIWCIARGMPVLPDNVSV